MKTVLYIHGMKGGEDSRIPAILSQALPEDYRVVVRIWDFEPLHGKALVHSWVEELQPDLVIGESLGAIHALTISNVPILLVSPALNTPVFFHFLASLVFIPGMRRLFNYIYRPSSERRQRVDFRYRTMRNWLRLRNEALNVPHLSVFAFFGTADHYRRSGIVRIKTYRKYFGDAYALYKGTHYMEEPYLYSMLIPKIKSICG